MEINTTVSKTAYLCYFETRIPVIKIYLKNSNEPHAIFDLIVIKGNHRVQSRADSDLASKGME